MERLNTAPTPSSTESAALADQLNRERAHWEQERQALKARIHSLEQSEALYRGMLENIPSTLALYDGDFGILYVNPVTASMRDLPQSAYPGKHFEDLWPPELAAQVLPFFHRALETNTLQTAEFSLTLPDGAQVVRKAHAIPLSISGGHPARLMSISFDITAHKRVEQELREDARHHSEFIAVLSHELRNPLSIIRSNLLLLSRSPEDGHVMGEAIAAMTRQINQLARLVDDLLDLSRIAQNKIHLKREPIDLCKLIRSVIDDHHVLFQESSIDLQAHFSAEPVPISGDRARIIQIVGNLLQNALKFTPAGGAVSVEVEALASQAVLRVKDNGAGAEPALLQRLFQPFVQAEHTLDRSKGGLGLGLSLVKALSELHGGSVRAESAGLGKGMLFCVTFPLETQLPLQKSTSIHPASHCIRRILLIEDNNDAAKAMSLLLRMDGHRVEIACDGPRGIDKAREFRPDIVFCDIGLPGMSGYDVARAFCGDEALKGIVLVALSGYTQPEDLKKAKDAGFARHLKKPVEFAHVDDVLASLPMPPGEPTK